MGVPSTDPDPCLTSTAPLVVLSFRHAPSKRASYLPPKRNSSCGGDSHFCCHFCCLDSLIGNGYYRPGKRNLYQPRRIMERVNQLHRESFRGQASEFGWRVSSTLFCLALLLLLLTL